MIVTLYRVITLLVAMAILLVGHGLQLTLLPVHAAAQGWTDTAIGLSASAYYLGFVAGCFLVPTVVSAVAHIRTFMVMGAVATISLLAAGLFVWLPAWMGLRFATGFAFAGLYMVIESWLAEASPPNKRGTVLGVYAAICLLGMSGGQALFALVSPDGKELFMIGAAILCAGIIPIGLTRVASPPPPPAIRLSLASLRSVSVVASVAAITGGLITGAFWALGPVVGKAAGLNAAGVGMFMSAGIIGGAVFQVPVGLLSDRIDRRVVIGGVMAAGGLAAGVGWAFAGVSELVLYGAIFMIGATALPLYALGIAHAADSSKLPLVELSGSILVMHSAGSLTGPIVVAALMDHLGKASFFAFMTVTLLLAAAWTFYRWAAVERRRERRHHAYMLPHTTQAVGELSPESRDNPAVSNRNRDE